MNFWKKLIITSILTFAVFFTQGIIDHLPAHAALHLVLMASKPTATLSLMTQSEEAHQFVQIC